MSRYDDPRWYEEQNTNPSLPKVPANDDFGQYPYPSYYRGEQDAAHWQNRSLPPPSEDLEPRRGKALNQALLLSLLVVIAFCGGWFSHQFFSNDFNPLTGNNQSKAYAQLFQEAWTKIDQNYVDRKAINYKTMSYEAITAMVKSLNDKGHTRFLTPDQVQSQNQSLSGKFIGIGITLNQDPKTKQLIIASPIPGSPAEKAGLRHGDVILAVNGINTEGKDVTAVSKLIKGDVGTTVSLTIQRPAVENPLTVKVTRAEIQVPNVIMHYIPESHIADIQIVQFSEGVSGQLKDELTKARNMGAKKIIIDLRDNPGGLLNEAIDTSSLFLQSGNVLLTQDSTGQRTPMPVTGNPVDTTDPIVVLTNEQTASAAEIVSGALQDNKRAVLIGQKTFGTGTVLQQIPLADGSALLLGTQEWLTPKGRFIREDKITPDTVVSLPTDATPITPNEENSENLTQDQLLHSSDVQLAAAIKYLENR